MRTDIKLRNRILRMKKVVEACRLYWKDYPTQEWQDIHYESREIINDLCDDLIKQIEHLYEESHWLGEDSWQLMYEHMLRRQLRQPKIKEEAL